MVAATYTTGDLSTDAARAKATVVVKPAGALGERPVAGDAVASSAPTSEARLGA